MVIRDERHFENRINLLAARDLEGNKKLIAKLERQKRNLKTGA